MKKVAFPILAILIALAMGLTAMPAQAIMDGTIDKSLSATEGELGDVVHVELEVVVPDGEVADVVDTLPEGLGFVEGSFVVNEVAAVPDIAGGQISYGPLDPGVHVIEFDVKVVEAKSWEPMEVCNVAVATFTMADGTMYQDEDVECFLILEFEQLHKNVGIPKADVVLSFDLTGSMTGVIGDVKAEANDIMNALAAQIGDVAFGVMSHMDYNGTYTTTEPGSVPETYSDLYGDVSSGDYPYQLDQDITTNTAAVATAIGGLTLGFGGDGSEDYTRIIHEAYNDPNLNWRTDATRFLIMFGDNVAHDSDFDYNDDSTPDNTGGDPGRDTVLGTTDDLDFETEVASAAADGIRVMPVWTWNSYQWQYAASETGGQFFNLLSAPDIATAVAELIKAEAEETLTICEQTCTQWAVVIDVVNPYGFTMTDVHIKDRFGGELKVDEIVLGEPTDPDVSKKKGKTHKVFLEWAIGDLDPDVTARTILLVSTDKNPGQGKKLDQGKWEYTSPGIYELNSGATLKFKDPDGTQLSAYTDSIYVIVLPAGECDG